MAKIEQPKSNGLLRSLLLLAIILFGFWILNDQGLMQVVLKGDKSHISKAIIILFCVLNLAEWIEKKMRFFRAGITALVAKAFWQ